MNKECVFTKGDQVSDKYTVQFFLEVNDGGEIYRVKTDQGKVRRLKLYAVDSLPAERFTESGILKEMEILQQVPHSQIIALLDSGTFRKDGKEFIYLLTDFVSGENCRKKLEREGPQNPYFVIPFAISLLETIQFLHDQKDPIIHNDLTPENVIISHDTKEEKPVLTNFSSATTLSQSSRNFLTELLNPFYMAPEQANGITLPQSDLYAVGALIYQMCFGMPPNYVSADTAEELQARLVNKRLKPLTFESNHMEVFDDQFLNVLRKALAPDLSNRFKNASEFIAALNRDKSVDLSLHQGDQKNNGIGTKKKGPGFKAIAGMEALKEILYNDVIRAIQEKERYERYGITIPNGLLLYGPPGCGKTFISEKFSEEVGFNFLKLNPSDIKSKYVNATEENIGKIFREAAEQAPTVLFFDELDALVPNREADLHQMHASTVNEFLAQMSNCAEKGIFIIAATNRPDRIDSAVLRSGRIDKKVYVAPPDVAARKMMFDIYLEKRPTDFSIDSDKLAALTEFYVASDIRYIVDESSRLALKKDERISQEILEKIITIVKPSIKKTTLEKYARLKEMIEDPDIDESSGRRPVGFRKNN